MAKKKRGSSKRVKQNDGLHILIVEARYYDSISDELLRGATRALDMAGARYDRITVPGTLEIPSAIAIAIDAARRRRASAYRVATAQEASRARRESARDVSTTGTRAPSTMPALSAFAK